MLKITATDPGTALRHIFLGQSCFQNGNERIKRSETPVREMPRSCPSLEK